MKTFAVKTLFLFGLITNICAAEEWKKCDVTKSTATDRDMAIALGKKKITFNFFKKQDYFYITMYVDEINVRESDLIRSGRRQYSDGSYYTGYADKTNTLRVQEFERDSTMIIGMSGDVDFTFYVLCK